jgi:NAD(P)-dependent dehydrogenase (short-subunit alcohol dehydrogenase family)
VVPYRVATRYDSGMDLDGAVAIVTGAAVGSGRAIAERLAAEGARVVVADVDEPGGEETVARIESGRARFVQADMTAACASSSTTRAAAATSRRTSPTRRRRSGARCSTST